MKTKLLVVAIVVALLAVVTAVTLRRTNDDEMCPSICRGDWYVQLPLSAAEGDVVRIRDPMDRARITLRRVLAVPGTRIGWQGNTPLVNGRDVRQRVMEEDAEKVILLEGDDVLLSTYARQDTTRVTPKMLRKTETWLAADARDVGLDSRHWGTMPAEDLGWVAVLRIGPSNAWQHSLGRVGRSKKLPLPGTP